MVLQSSFEAFDQVDPLALMVGFCRCIGKKKVTAPSRGLAPCV